jgi:hypothetical protein
MGMALGREGYLRSDAIGEAVDEPLDDQERGGEAGEAHERAAIVQPVEAVVELIDQRDGKRVDLRAAPVHDQMRRGSARGQAGHAPGVCGHAARGARDA